MSFNEKERLLIIFRDYMNGVFDDIFQLIQKDYILITGNITLIPIVTYLIFPKQTFEFVKDFIKDDNLSKLDYERGSFCGYDKLNYIQMDLLPEGLGFNSFIVLWKRNKKVKEFFNLSNSEFESVLNIEIEETKNKNLNKNINFRDLTKEKIIYDAKKVPRIFCRIYCYQKCNYLKNAKGLLNYIKDSLLNCLPQLKKW